MGSPICTAVAGEPSCNSSEEKVAPWMPSLPMRPPTMTTTSLGLAAFTWLGLPDTLAGMRPTVPQNTRGLPRKRSSKTTEPFTVGMPDLLPPCSTPSRTPSITRLGCRSLGGSSWAWKGEAKQNTSVLHSRLAPMPVPMGSRFTPTMPVKAPP